MMVIVGCSSTGKINSFLTPAAVQQEIAAALDIAVLASPKLVPDLDLSRDIICAESGKNGATPQSIANGFKNAGITNQTVISVVTDAIGVLNFAVSQSPTNTQAYVAVLCPAFQEALGSTVSQRKVGAKKVRGLPRLMLPK